MKCKKCLKEIDEVEIYCEECKQKLEQETQLNELIDENIELNKLEITKEIEILDELKEENFKSLDIKEELKDIVKIDEFEKKESSKKIIIIGTVLFCLILMSIIICLLLFNKSSSNEEEKINYKEALNEYGNLLKETITDYIKTGEDIPSWNVINKNLKYNKYKIICNIHEIYDDGKIYLNECKIDGQNIKYSYGKKQTQIKGKEIKIYKTITEINSFVYSEEESDNLVGTLICETEDCELVSAYETYAIIKENDKYYLYNYIKNKILSGPFDISDIENNILVYENNLYGILYNEINKQKIYSIKTDKSSDYIEGNLVLLGANYDPKLMYKYGYAIFETDEGFNFVNLNTGKTSYTIPDDIKYFIESKDNKIVYIATSNNINQKLTIYNNNGKKLFEGKEYNSIKLYDEKIIVYDDYKFSIYDLNLKLLLDSNSYDNILGMYEDVFVIINKGNLELINIDDKLIVSFDFKWEDNYQFNNELSIYKKIDKGFEIDIVIEDYLENISYNLIYNSTTNNFKIIEN